MYERNTSILRRPFVEFISENGSIIKFAFIKFSIEEISFIFIGKYIFTYFSIDTFFVLLIKELEKIMNIAKVAATFSLHFIHFLIKTNQISKKNLWNLLQKMERKKKKNVIRYR